MLWNPNHFMIAGFLDICSAFNLKYMTGLVYYTPKYEMITKLFFKTSKLKKTQTKRWKTQNLIVKIKCDYLSQLVSIVLDALVWFFYLAIQKEWNIFAWVLHFTAYLLKVQQLFGFFFYFLIISNAPRHEASQGC